MSAFIVSRISAIWLFLVLATLASWEIGHGLGFQDHRASSAAIIAVAMLKVRFVIRDFMEIRHAPLAYRLVADLWAGGIAIGLAAMILFA
ncbi:cytochrome C oxidase subunit IV family protein [Zavarzinia compransoris]|uniref:Prokaryotic cytochrome C oxidase subunit IV family protein n=1 Tax=Zavarzinia compransoris TaxID=1264899 RepID=A0A317E1K9_9PROT|nr:cytochrome C oxidase subunit IV family protein [Zavarzinia compransoris]PWR20948.1 hypothetical protein DKG75_13235 [Zavarzinia compransoris]TDP43976.1 cytochrome c oxidase subunit IV [Zavarzinia compransoris]